MTVDRNEILAHVARYHLTTIDSVAELFFAEKTREAARVCLYRLAAARYVTRWELRSRSFYRLTPLGCRELGVPLSLSRAFDTQTLVDRYGVLAYCCFKEQKHVRLMPGEFQQYFPTLAGTPGIKPEIQHYYIDQSTATRRLGRIIVDGGTSAVRLARKFRELEKAAAKSALGDLIVHGLYGITLLTAEPAKQRATLTALSRHRYAFPITVETVPELRHVRY